LIDSRGESFEAKSVKLTVKENQVLTLVTLAKTNKEIVRALDQPRHCEAPYGKFVKKTEA
jgi:hypothetical protein